MALEKHSSKASDVTETSRLIAIYKQSVANHYNPMKDMVISEAENYFVKAVDGRVFVDFFASYAVVNQGHVNPDIIAAGIKQMLKAHSSSGAYYNDQYPQLAKMVSETFGYEKMMPCNGGAEAVEAAIKIATRFWHNKMAENRAPIAKDDKDQAVIVTAKGGYHGQSAGVWPALIESRATEYTEGFSPPLRNRRIIPYGNIEALEALFKAEGKNIAAFLVEPIQGEGGVITPPEGYFQQVRELCTQHGILLIMDEIQAGMGRAGKLLCQENYGIRADIVTVAKALTGGVGPMSLVLADDRIMRVLGPGDHGSTFGGNPLMSAIAMAAINVIKEQKLHERSAELGGHFKTSLETRLQQFRECANPVIKDIRGKGLFIGLEFTDSAIPARDALLRAGVMCKQTNEKTLRITPPLTISKEAIDIFVNMAEEICTHIKTGTIKDLNMTPMAQQLKERHNIAPKFDGGRSILERVMKDLEDKKELRPMSKL